jgi:anti-sigma factor RsiW
MRIGRSATLAAFFATGLAIGAQPAALHAQAAPKGAPTKAQIDNAAVVLGIITSALQSEQVEQPVKNALFECLYANSVAKVSEATDKVIAANAGKVDRKDPSQMLAVIAGVCGYRPAAKPAAKPVPKK